MAIRIYSSAIEIDPKASILYTKRAAAYMSSRQASQALRDLNQAIENDNTFVQGYITRGKLHRQMCK
jgi:DnaJ family protein C protein 3